MSAAVAYEDLYGKGGEKFARMFQYSLNEVAANNDWRAGSRTDTLEASMNRLIPSIEHLAFMTLLSIRDKIPLSPEWISRLRNVYLELNAKLLENPDIACLPEAMVEALRNACDNLATSLCFVDVAHSSKIQAILGRE